MTNEYIRKQDAVDYCKALMNAELVQHTDDWGYGKERYNQTEVILNFIENRQPADVVPVVHAYWMPQKENREFKEVWMKCSACGYPVSRWTGNTNFCPNCGAKMYEHGEE